MITTSQTRASHRRHRDVAVALAVVLIATFGVLLRPAAAAQLPTTQAKITSVSVSDRCTPTVAATNGTITGSTATTVLLTGLGAGCGGRSVSLTLFGTTGAALTTAITTLPAGATGSATVVVPAYSPVGVAGAAVTVGTWGVPATWAYSPPVAVPTVSCRVLNDPTGTKTCSGTNLQVDAWGSPLHTANIYVTVVSPSTTADVEWELSINLSDPALKVYADLADSNNAVQLAPGWSCSSMPTLALRGQSLTGTKLVGSGRTVTVWLQVRASSVPTSGGNLFNCS